MQREHLTINTPIQTCNKRIFATRKSSVSCSASRSRGFGLVEIIVASSILAVSMLAVSTYFQSTLKMSRATGDGNEASYLLEEGIEALKIMRDTSYASNLLNASTSTPRYFEWLQATSTWAATSTDILIDNKFERKFTIGDVYRDNATFDISTSTTGTTYDPNVKLATVKVTWLSGVQGGGTLTKLSPAYVNTLGYAISFGFCISPDGKFLYTGGSSTTSNTYHVIILERDMNTGKLTKKFDVDTGVAPASGGFTVVQISPDGKSIYVAISPTKIVLMYSRNVVDGSISLVGAGSVSLGSNPSSLVVSPDNNFVYVLTSSYVYRFNRNQTTGELTNPTTVNSGNSCTGPIVITTDGKSMYEVGGCSTGNGYLRQYHRDVSTGALTHIGNATFTERYPRGLSTSSDGNFVYATALTSSTISMFRRNASDSTLTPLSPSKINSSVGGPFEIAISPDGFFAYEVSYSNSRVSQYSRDVTTGLLTPLTPKDLSADSSVPCCVVVSPDGSFVYVAGYYAGRVSQYSRNPGVTIRTIQTYITNLFSN